jgi:hypothetical protein
MWLDRNSPSDLYSINHLLTHSPPHQLIHIQLGQLLQDKAVSGHTTRKKTLVNDLAIPAFMLSS